jgi:hypothetical protein
MLCHCYNAWLLSPSPTPLLSASGPSFSVFLCVAGQSYCEGGGGANHKATRKPGLNLSILSAAIAIVLENIIVLEKSGLLSFHPEPACRGNQRIFSWKISFLLRKRITEPDLSQGLDRIVRYRSRDSCILREKG